MTTRLRPFPEHPQILVSYLFTGEPQTVYTTLVVRLWYSGEFSQRELWRNAAEFETSTGKRLGLLMQRTGEGQAKLSVFFEAAVPDEVKAILIEYVHRHLNRYARNVQRERRYVCANPKCGEPVLDAAAILARRTAGQTYIRCQRCDRKIPLVDHIEQKLSTDPIARQVLGMDRKASDGLDRQAVEQNLIGHLMAVCGEASQVFRPLPTVDGSIDGEVEFRDNDGQLSGRKIYLVLESDDSRVQLRQIDDRETIDITEERHLRRWIGLPGDVYVVIRDPKEDIRWMNITRQLRERSDVSSRRVAFTGRRLDAPEVWRVRDEFVPRRRV